MGEVAGAVGLSGYSSLTAFSLTGVGTPAAETTVPEPELFRGPGVPALPSNAFALADSACRRPAGKTSSYTQSPGGIGAGWLAAAAAARERAHVAQTGRAASHLSFRLRQDRHAWFLLSGAGPRPERSGTSPALEVDAASWTDSSACVSASSSSSSPARTDSAEKVRLASEVGSDKEKREVLVGAWDLEGEGPLPVKPSSEPSLAATWPEAIV